MVSFPTVVRVVFAAARAAGAFDLARRAATAIDPRQLSRDLMSEAASYWRDNKSELEQASESELVNRVARDFRFEDPRTGQQLPCGASDIRREL